MKTVLVDDHALFRDGVSSLLLAWGHEVARPAADGEQAIELVEAGAPGEVLMGVRVPNDEGSDEPGRPTEVAIVVLTVSKEEADLFRAIKAGAQGHLPPSLEAPRLRSMLEGAARGETTVPAGRSRVSDEFLAAPMEAAQSDLQRLTGRELEVLDLVTQGLRNRQIAGRMGISENTVKFHLKNVAEKLHASNRAELAARAVRGGLMPGRAFAVARRPRRVGSAGRPRQDLR